jgi:hypothetical protein
MRFELDRATDVVTATFRSCVLTTPADVVRWRQRTEAELRKFGRKVDLLIDLEGLSVRAGASNAFGEHRAQILARFTNRSYRYNGDPVTRTTIFTTAVLFKAPANVHPTREDALAALLADRHEQEQG